MPLSIISILVSKSNFDCASESNLEAGAGAGTDIGAGAGAEGKGGGIGLDSPHQWLFGTGGTLQGYLKKNNNNNKHHLKITYSIITIIINNKL